MTARAACAARFTSPVTSLASILRDVFTLISVMLHSTLWRPAESIRRVAGYSSKGLGSEHPIMSKMVEGVHDSRHYCRSRKVPVFHALCNQPCRAPGGSVAYVLLGYSTIRAGYQGAPRTYPSNEGRKEVLSMEGFMRTIGIVVIGGLHDVRRVIPCLCGQNNMAEESPAPDGGQQAAREPKGPD